MLALAHRPLPELTYLKAQKLPREDLERDLEFLGFLVMQNKLKAVTTSVIEQLNEANIRTIMATGDNVLTAISVGRECGIIDGSVEVYLGEAREDNHVVTGVSWKSTRNGRQVLNRDTLTPDNNEGNGITMAMRKSTMQKHESSVEADLQSLNDVVSLNDFPWQHPPEEYAIALTGKALNLLMNDPSQEAVLKQVLLKA